MKAKDLFFHMMSKLYQKCHIYYQRNGYENCFTTYAYFILRSIYNIVSVCTLDSAGHWPNISTSDPDPGSDSKNLSLKKVHF